MHDIVSQTPAVMLPVSYCENGNRWCNGIRKTFVGVRGRLHKTVAVVFSQCVEGLLKICISSFFLLLVDKIQATDGDSVYKMKCIKRGLLNRGKDLGLRRYIA